MSGDVLDAIRAHAVQDYPREACGLVVVIKGRQRYWPARNRATEAHAHFVLDPADYAAAEDAGAVVAVVHSHPDAAATPSDADRVACEASGLPWLIVSVMPGPVAEGIHRFEPCGYTAPLVGRSFHHGVLDCWALCRDWYARERGITLPDPLRRDDWWNDGQSDLYSTAALTAAGFVPVPLDALQGGDILTMQIRSRNGVPNHAGIYLGDGTLLHHLHGRLSSRDVFGGYWLETTRGAWRYRGPPRAA